jgi:hypothetical protein
MKMFLGILLAASTQAVSAAGYVTLSKHGEDVLSNCNPQCKVTSLPGEGGYDLVASRSAPLIYNEIEIGTVYEKVWRHHTKPKLHIFGTRVILNTSQWDSSGEAFRVNDLFRQTRPGKKVSVAYHLDGATTALKKAGRTVQGLNEYEEDEPERDNTWVDFRVAVDGLEDPVSPWVLAKTRAPTGFDLNAFGLRVLNSDFDDVLNAVDFFTTSYQPNGVPPPEDDDDDEEEED